MSDTPNFEKIEKSKYLSELDLAVIFYGIDTESDHDAKQDAESAATELIDLRAKEAELIFFRNQFPTAAKKLSSRCQR
jgi:hypothetical protein